MHETFAIEIFHYMYMRLYQIRNIYIFFHSNIYLYRKYYNIIELGPNININQ